MQASVNAPHREKDNTEQHEYLSTTSDCKRGHATREEECQPKP